MLRMASAGIEHRWASTSSSEAPAAASADRAIMPPLTHGGGDGDGDVGGDDGGAGGGALGLAQELKCAGCRGPIRNAKRVEKAVFDAGRLAASLGA